MNNIPPNSHNFVTDAAVALLKTMDANRVPTPGIAAVAGGEVMDDQKAWELVLENGDYGIGSFAPGSKAAEEYVAALDHLRGKHAYFSRFTPDDTVFYISRFGNDGAPEIWRIGGIASFATALSIPDRCFTTRAEAQAECDRRNKEGE